MEDGRVFLTRGAGGYTCYYDTVTTDNVYVSHYGVEATHQIQQDLSDTGKVIDAGICNTTAYMLMDNGNLYTWGQNNHGQLGLGDFNNRYQPTLAATSVAQVYTHGTNSQRTSSYSRLFIKKTNGKIYGCGYNGLGALGIGNLTNQASFVEITGAGVNPKSVWNLGAFAGCLVVQRADGVVVLAGYNGYGNLGNGTATNILTLTAVPAWNNSDNTLVLERVEGGYGYADSSAYNHCNTIMWFKGTSTDLVKAAGANNWGSLATGNFNDSNVPVTITIPGVGRIKDISTPGAAPCAVFVLKDTGALYGWGYNGQGILANGTLNSTNTPGLITSDVLDMPFAHEYLTTSYEYFATFFIRKADGYYASGRGNKGQAGIGYGPDTIRAFSKMRLPRGTVINFWGRNMSDSYVVNTFMVDDKNRWWACGDSLNYAVSNQRWVDSNNNIYGPIRVQPFEILSANGY
jgi:alpha-tubulin suppressor-like RCC1 family protein